MLYFASQSATPPQSAILYFRMNTHAISHCSFKDINPKEKLNLNSIIKEIPPIANKIIERATRGFFLLFLFLPARGLHSKSKGRQLVVVSRASPSSRSELSPSGSPSSPSALPNSILFSFPFLLCLHSICLVSLSFSFCYLLKAPKERARDPSASLAV